MGINNLGIKSENVFFDISDSIELRRVDIRQVGHVIEMYLCIYVKNVIGNNTLLMKSHYPPKVPYEIFYVVKDTVPYNIVSDCSIWLGSNNAIILYGSLPIGTYYMRSIYTF